MNPMTNTISQDTPQDKLGSVGQLNDGRSFVLFERKLDHSVEKVWSAISDPDQRAAWFPEIKIDLKLGGKFEIWFGGDCEGPPHVSGRVSEYDPPRVLQCGGMRFELEDNNGGCLLRFSDILTFEDKRSNTELTNSVLGGWHSFLDRLEQALDGKPIDHDIGELDYSKFEIVGRQ